MAGADDRLAALKVANLPEDLRRLSEALEVALIDAGFQQKGNDYAILTVPAGEEDDLDVPDDKGGIGLGFTVLSAPNSGTDIRLNAGPRIEDVQDGDNIGDFEVRTITVDNTDGGAEAQIFVPIRTGVSKLITEADLA